MSESGVNPSLSSSSSLLLCTFIDCLAIDDDGLLFYVWSFIYGFFIYGGIFLSTVCFLFVVGDRVVVVSV